MAEDDAQSEGLEHGERFQRLAEVLRELIGQRAKRVLFPGGSRRKSAVIITDGDDKVYVADIHRAF